MVRSGRRYMYVDEDFFKLTNTLRAEVENITGKRVYTPELTKDISDFLRHEKLVDHMVRNARKKRRFFL